MLTAAMLDCRPHHTEIAQIQEDSDSLRDKRKAAITGPAGKEKAIE